jgi:membrane associated rhomboid family serine protease
MFFPYGTNAPIYYWPITTVGMIVANLVIFYVELTHPEQAANLVLEIGNGIHPAQWLTCNFAHLGPGHLLGNMIALWSFGLVVEGKLGACKTLFVYLGIGVLHGAIVQLLMLDAYPSACLGASAIIFGFMAMSLIWAPENEMECVLIYCMRPFFFEVRIKIMVALMLCFQLLILILTGGALSSEFLHAVGALLGFCIGIGMLKAGWVDCENWDIFSVWAGRHKLSREELQRLEAETPEAKQREAERLRMRQEQATVSIRRAIEEGQPIPAWKLFQKITHESPDWTIPESDWLLLIRSFHERRLWLESMPAMIEYLSRHKTMAAQVRLKLAQIVLMEEKRPRKAIKIMSEVDLSALNDKQLEFFRNLRKKADEMYGKDAYELAE